MDRRKLVKSSIAGVGAATVGSKLALAQDSTPVASPVAAASPVGEIGADGHYPSGTPGVPDAWTKMPEPFKSTDGVPGNGGTVRAMVMIYGAPPPPKGENQYWQGLDERLGVNWDPILVPNSSYGEKASALIASGDIPEMFYLNFNQTLTPLQKFVKEGAFLDLTDYVTGDNLQKYPNLAAFPDFMWDATKTDGRIYGVPCPSGRAGQVAAYRTDWAERFIGGKPTNRDEFYNLLHSVTFEDPNGNGRQDTWGMARYETNWDMSIIYPMHRVPNNWRVNDDGTFTKDYETEEFRNALEFMRKMYEDGLFHPDSASMGYEEAINLFTTGRVELHADGGNIYGRGGFLETIRQYQPEAELARLIPFGWDGGDGVTYNLPGIFGFTAISSMVEDDERIDELLRIFNWLCAPFGSEEWLYKAYGTEGVHFEFNENGFPVANEVFERENGGLTAYIGGSPLVFVNAEQPDIAPLQTDEGNAIIKLGIDNPAANLFSNAAINNGPTLSQLIGDAITSIITGRESMEFWDKTLDDWRSRGGDEIRRELEEAHAAAQ